MKSFIYKMFGNFKNFEYVSAWVVLIIDLIISILSSIISLIGISFVSGKPMIYHNILHVCLVCFTTSLLAFYLLKTYRTAVRHTDVDDIFFLLLASLIKVIVAYPIIYLLAPATTSDITFHNWILVITCGVCDLIITFILLTVSRVLMVFAYRSFKVHYSQTKNLKKILIYGTSDKSLSLVTRFLESPHFSIQGFLKYGDGRDSLKIANKTVFHFKDESTFVELVSKYMIDGVMFSVKRELNEEHDRLLKYALAHNVSLYIAPEVDELGSVNGSLPVMIREINIEDLLGRPEIKLNENKIKSDFRGKTIMVTGAAGSIGSQLVRQLSCFHVGNIILFDNAETPMHNIRLELEKKYPSLNFVPVIGDVRQKERLDFVFRKYHPQIVFHAAAYKHVPLMEDNPCEAVLVNVVGSRNVAEKCLEYGAEKMVMISTDKAVNPTNVMGCSKRLAEMYVQSVGKPVSATGRTTQFITTRFGNVLGSNGSVIPLFKEQIASGGPVTVTHPDITRFFMTIPEACRLVMEAACMGEDSQIFVFDMGDSVKIVDLARRMIELSGLVPDKDIKISFTGLRPGEKLYEEVLANTENTLPTSHQRINVAKVRDTDYAEMVAIVDKLEKMSKDVDISGVVKFMKEVVPEYISNNSIFCKYDEKK